MPAALLLLLGGLVVCFFGRRLFRASLAIVGFVIGAGAASSIFGVSDRMPMMVAGLVGGLIGAAILYAAYYIGVALVGAALGAVAANVGSRIAQTEPPVYAILLFAVAGAVASTYLQRYFVIVGSGFVGALMMVHGALLLAGQSFGLPGAGPRVGARTRSLRRQDRAGCRSPGSCSALVGVAVQMGWTGGDKGRIGRRKPKPA